MAIDPTVVRDVVVVIPGIMGSALVDRDGRPVWAVSPGALARAIRTLGRSIQQLRLPEGIGDEHPDDGIRPAGLMNSLHVIPGIWSPITGYDGLLNFLRGQRFHLVEADPIHAGVVPNLIPFAYDWRLSNRHNARLLARTAREALEGWRAQPGMEEAKLVLICHSMGGLIARWFAEQEGGAELIRSIITIGTPHRGSVNALVNLVNGLDAGLGPLQISLTEFARSLPSLYQLLPQYNCLDTGQGRAGLDQIDCPGLDRTRLRDAMAFHRGIEGNGAPRYALYKVAGIRQPTPTTVRLDRGALIPSNEIDGHDQGGDGTVPRLAAEPIAGRGVEVHEIADQHGVLQETRSLLDLVDGILARREIVWRAVPAETFGIEMKDVWTTGEAVRLRVADSQDQRLLATLEDEQGVVVAHGVPVAPDGTIALGPLPEGGYRAMVRGAGPGGPKVVTKPFLVMDPPNTHVDL